MCKQRLQAWMLLLCAASSLWTTTSRAVTPGDDAANAGPPRAGNTAASLRTYRQLKPEEPVAGLYARTSSISFMLASVPDPRVPRHRRTYDLAIIALLQGMQDQGYSLDRFSLPWQDVLSGQGGGEDALPTDDGGYGVMLFRRDLWREDGSTRAPAIRAVYLLPETSTYGVPIGTAQKAIEQTLSQLADGQAPGAGAARLSTHPSCTAARAGRYLVLSGPHFSGSVDSIAQIDASLAAQGGPNLCAISPSASAASNRRIAAPDERAGLQFKPMAVDDDTKLASLWDLATRLGATGRDQQIAILYDTTLYGSEICPVPAGERVADCTRRDLDVRGKRQCLCRRAARMSYPSNIADVRAAMQPDTQQDESLTRNVALGRYLPLDHGAGNGSEFPDGRQSQLGATGAYLQLQRLVQVLGNLGPKLVVVAGTDVRDRMFLFEQLRAGVPGAQLVDLEADTLSHHPQYIHATRGAVLMASERIAWTSTPRSGGTGLEVGATDVQVLQRAVVRGLDQSGAWQARTGLPRGCGFSTSDGPVMHVVSRKAVLPLLCPTTKERTHRLIAAPSLALGALLLLVLASPMSRRWNVLSARAHTPWLPAYHRMRRFTGGYDPAVNRTVAMAVLAVVAMLLMAYLLEDRVLGAIVVVVSPVYAWALSYLAGAYDTVDGRAATREGPALRKTLLGMLVLLLAVLMLLLWLMADDFSEAVIVRLGFAARSGMALCLALMMAVLVLLLADSAMAVAIKASARNEAVLLKALGLDRESEERARLRSLFECSLLPRSMLLAAGLIGLVLCLLHAFPVKLTVFGLPAAWLALASVLAMSYVSLLFLVIAIRMRQRALKVAALLRDNVLAPGINGRDMNASGLWPAALSAGLRFASTPAVARVKDGGRCVVSLLAPAGMERFVQALRAHPVREPVGTHQPSERDTRIAAFAMLASEVSLVRWPTFCGVASCLAVAGFVYLYPVSGADAFMLFNLAVLALTGLFAGHTAMSFERNEVMSNILCNRTAKVEWSGTLFNYVAVPFAVLVIVIGITQIPGVINLGGGMFDSTLKELAFTVFGGL